jgi:hypothetical protein
MAGTLANSSDSVYQCGERPMQRKTMGVVRMAAICCENAFFSVVMVKSGLTMEFQVL